MVVSRQALIPFQDRDAGFLRKIVGILFPYSSFRQFQESCMQFSDEFVFCVFIAFSGSDNQFSQCQPTNDVRALTKFPASPPKKMRENIKLFRARCTILPPGEIVLLGGVVCDAPGLTHMRN
jgi:hypothetical protein